MHGDFDKKLPQPRYSVTWDVQVIVDYIKSNWAVSKEITMKNISYRLVILLALTSASRASTLQGLDVRFMTAHLDHVKFAFSKICKVWKKGQRRLSVLHYDYKKDETLHFTSTIKVYLARTKTWRQENNETQYVLSHIKPSKGLSSSTVTRLINEVISLAGFNTKIFKGHLSKSASSISANLVGVSVTDILNMGSWSNVCTWQKSYPVVSPVTTFETSLQRKKQICFEQRIEIDVSDCLSVAT